MFSLNFNVLKFQEAFPSKLSITKEGKSLLAHLLLNLYLTITSDRPLK